MNGRNGVCRSSGEQLPDKIKAPDLPMRCRNSWSSRDLPMPGSPAMSMTWMPCSSRRGLAPALELAVAPDIGGEAATQRRVEARGALADGIEPIDLLRLGLAFDLMLAREGRLDHSLDQATRHLGHAYRTRLGQRLKPRRNIHRVAENGDACVGAALHAAHHRRPGIEADAQLRPHAVLRFEIAPRGFQPLQNRKRCATRPQRRVFEGDRRAKDSHDAVAGKALDDAALLAHGVIHQLRKAAHKRKGRFFSRPFRESREARPCR